MEGLAIGAGGHCAKMEQAFSPCQLTWGMATQSVCMKGKSASGKQPTIQRNWDRHLYKRTTMSGTGTKAKSLVEIVMPLSNVREEIYGALDEWVAFELEFPVIAVRKALERLRQKKQWQRIIQVSKWMLSKGQGQTFGTYDLMLKAYFKDARLEDAEELWESLLAKYSSSVPKSMFAHMMSIYKRVNMPEKLVAVFEQMENFDMNPDRDILQVVEKAYKDIGMAEKEKQILEKYPPKLQYYTYNGKTIRVPPRKMES